MMGTIICDTPVLAERYDRVSNSQFEHGKLLVREMNIRAGDHALDIGCGTGRLAEYISDIIGAKGRIYGIDPAEYRIQIAKQKIRNKNPPNIFFEVGKGEDLSCFENNSFDKVIMNMVFGWVADKKITLSEVFKVLKPEGLVGITTPSKGLPGPLNDITEGLLKKEPYASQIKLKPKGSVNTDELFRMLIDAGFIDIDLKLRRTAVHYRNTADLIEFMEASHSGNYLTHVPVHLRDAYMSEYIHELEKRQTPAGIESVWNMLHVTARKTT